MPATDTRWTRLFALLAFIPRFLHELTHAFLGLPFAREVRICLRPGSLTAYTDIEFEGSTPPWGVWLAFLAPFLLGCLLITAGAAYTLLYGAPVPDSVSEWLWSGILGVWWAIYAYPSPSDRQGAHDIIHQLNTDQGTERGDGG